MHAAQCFNLQCLLSQSFYDLLAIGYGVLVVATLQQRRHAPALSQQLRYFFATKDPCICSYDDDATIQVCSTEAKWLTPRKNPRCTHEQSREAGDTYHGLEK